MSHLLTQYELIVYNIYKKLDDMGYTRKEVDPELSKIYLQNGKMLTFYEKKGWLSNTVVKIVKSSIFNIIEITVNKKNFYGKKTELAYATIENCNLNLKYKPKTKEFCDYFSSLE